MADLTVTVSQVLPDSTAAIETGLAGATITAGQTVYKDDTTGTYKLFDANLAAANTGAPRVALNGASSGQSVSVQGPGALITIGAGAAPTAGIVYVASATAGGIAPAADLASGWKTAIVGVGATGNKLQLICNNSGQSV